MASEQKNNHFKPFFLDVGLVLTALGLNIDAVATELNNTARGAVAEQFIAQHLLDHREMFQKPQLFYWQRQKQGASSEVDFLTVFKGKIVPIEVKSGAVGSMKSLQVFLSSRPNTANQAIRFLSNLPERQRVKLAISDDRVRGSRSSRLPTEPCVRVRTRLLT